MEFEIHKEIGKGSFATVYSGKYNNLQVAIKVVNKQRLNKKLYENLRTEINILKSHRHMVAHINQHIVSLFNVVESPKEINLIMEYCQYSDLSIYIKKRGIGGESQGIWGGLDEFVVRYFLGQLASALEFLRQNQIIHRDLKPQVLSF